MATHRISMLNHSFKQDNDNMYWAPLDSVVVLTTGTQQPLAFFMTEGAADEGFEGAFQVPQNYVGSEAVIACYVLDGFTDTQVVGFTSQYIFVADGETADAAYGTARLGSTTLSAAGGDADEDYLETSTDISAETIAAGDMCFFKFQLDISANTFTGKVALVDLLFEYADA